MKVLFAIKDENNIVSSIVKKYKSDYDKNLLYKEVSNFTAINKEIQKNNDYDRIVISDNFDKKVNESDEKQAILLKKLKGLLSVAIGKNGKKIPIIYLSKDVSIAKKVLELGINNFLIGSDIGKKNIYELINKPRTIASARAYYKGLVIEVKKQNIEKITENIKSDIKKSKESKKVATTVKPKGEVIDEKMQKSINYLNRRSLTTEKYVQKFEAAYEIFTKAEMKKIVANITDRTKDILKGNSSKYRSLMGVSDDAAEKKRGRGRPRKVVSESEIEVKEKRGRGRPRKNPVETEDSVSKEKSEKKQTKDSVKTASIVEKQVNKTNLKESKSNQKNNDIKYNQKDIDEKKKSSKKGIEKNKISGEELSDNDDEKKTKKRAIPNEEKNIDTEDEFDDIEINLEDDFDDVKLDKDDELEDIDMNENDLDEDVDFDDVELDEDDDLDDVELDEDDDLDDVELDEDDDLDDVELDEDDDLDDVELDEDDDLDDVELDEDDDLDDVELDEDDDLDDVELDEDDDLDDVELDEDDDLDDVELDEDDDLDDVELDGDDDLDDVELDEDDDLDDVELDEDDDLDDVELDGDDDLDDVELDEDDDLNDVELDGDDDLDDVELDDTDIDEDDYIDHIDIDEDDDIDDVELNQEENDSGLIDFDEEDDDSDMVDMNDDRNSSELIDLDDDEDSGIIDFDEEENDAGLIDLDDEENTAGNADLDGEENDSGLIDLDEDENDSELVDSDEDEDDSGLIDLDDDEDDSGLIDLDEDKDDSETFDIDEEESDSGIIDLDSDADSESNNIDDESDEIDLQEEENDSGIKDLDDDDSDDFNADEDENGSEIMDLDDDDIADDDDSEGDLVDFDDNEIFDLDNDEESDDIGLDESVKIADKGIGAAGNSFRGIQNKNYNPNYDISKQIRDIDGDNSEDDSKASNNNSHSKVEINENKNVIAFVGAHNSGTSFLVNNIATMLSEQGVNVAILDLTKNKNSYYIYTENEESIRSIAYSSFEKLKSGIADGIKVNKNLTVYTALPNSEAELENKDTALSVLLKTHSLVLMDCDFDTKLDYFKTAQNIFFVQSFDILTIQALTGFIKKLKMNKVDFESKMRIVVNKVVNTTAISERAIVAALSVYNSPDTTYQLDLFERNKAEYTIVPFEERNYCKYLDDMVKCKITVRGYSKSLINSLNRLIKMVYPIEGKNKMPRK